MQLHQCRKLHELRVLYPQEYRDLKVENYSNEDVLETLAVLEFDQNITSSINDLGYIFGEDKAIELFVSVIARSYGQLLHLYGKNNGDPDKLRKLFETQLTKTEKSYG